MVTRSDDTRRDLATLGEMTGDLAAEVLRLRAEIERLTCERDEARDALTAGRLEEELRMQLNSALDDLARIGEVVNPEDDEPLFDAVQRRAHELAAAHVEVDAARAEVAAAREELAAARADTRDRLRGALDLACGNTHAERLATAGRLMAVAERLVDLAETVAGPPDDAKPLAADLGAAGESESQPLPDARCPACVLVERGTMTGGARTEDGRLVCLAHAPPTERCPACRGTGRHDHLELPDGTADDCRKCGGRGRVTKATP